MASITGNLASTMLNEYFKYKGDICQVKGVVEIDNTLYVILDQPAENTTAVPPETQGTQSLYSLYGISEEKFRKGHSQWGTPLSGFSTELAKNNVVMTTLEFGRNGEYLNDVPKSVPSHHSIAVPAYRLEAAKASPERLVNVGEKCGSFGVVNGIFVIGNQLVFSAVKDGVGISYTVPKTKRRAQNFFAHHGVAQLSRATVA